ncbi:MAG: AMP-binding protein [Rhodothermales bacterium]|nr:AMP-binding protein [Rhodothermales bacterium]
MIVSSPLPDIAIPSLSLHAFVMKGFGAVEAAPALIDGASGRTLTYSALRAAIERVAAGLHAYGLRQGDVVALYSPNVPEYAVVFFAVSMNGAVNTTINPTYTPDELHYQLVDSGAVFLVAHPAGVDTAWKAAKGTRVRHIVVLGEAENGISYETLRASREPAPVVTIDPANDLVVLPYSSGTTGLPKGVMLTHANLVANILQTRAALPIDASEVLIGILPFYHIYGMTAIMGLALHAGATVVTMPRFEPEAFLQHLQDNGVTLALLVPPIILLLAKHPLVDQYDLSRLRHITSGAAPLSEGIASMCQNRLGCTVRQGYGLTETSPVTHLCSPGVANKMGSVGPSVPNTETCITDPATGQLLPVGATGEIWLRGPQVMRGYHNNPGATRAMLDEKGWLHTGDIGYLDADGYLYVIDRVKELIKYKGLQIAPAELEAILLSHPEVADAAVIPSADEEAGEVPRAFVVLKAGVRLTDEALMAYVAERVAPYKRIRRVTFIDQIPKVPSGKILRRVLIERERAERAERS